MIDFGSYIQHGPEFEGHPTERDLPFVLWDEDADAWTYGICSTNEKLRQNQKVHCDTLPPPLTGKRRNCSSVPIDY